MEHTQSDPITPASLLDVSYEFTYADVLGCLEDTSSPVPEFSTKIQYTSFRDALAGIFSNFSIDIYTEVSNHFGFEGVSDYDLTSVANSECHLSTVQPQAPSPSFLKDATQSGNFPGVAELLKMSLQIYVDEIEGVIKGACMISDSDPLLISQSFAVLLAVWNDLRTKLANTSTLFAGYGLPLDTVRDTFIDALTTDLINEERTKKIISLIINGISTYLLGSEQPHILSLRAMISFIGAIHSQHIDELVDKLIPSVVAILRGKLNGLLANKQGGQKASLELLHSVQSRIRPALSRELLHNFSLSVSDCFYDSEEETDSEGRDDLQEDDAHKIQPSLPSDEFADVTETEISIPIGSADNADDSTDSLLVRHHAPMMNAGICVAILSVISSLNEFTEVLTYLLQVTYMELPTKVATATGFMQRNSGVFMPSQECLNILEVQSNLSHLRTSLLSAVLSELEPLLKSPILSYTVIFNYFNGGKGVLYHLYILAYEAEERYGTAENSPLSLIDNFITRSLDISLKYVYRNPGTYALCMDKLLANPFVVEQSYLKSHPPIFPVAQVLAINLVYLNSVFEDIQETLRYLLSNSLLVTLRKMQSNLSSGKVYELENPSLKAYVYTAAYIDTLCYNSNSSVAFVSAEAILVLIDSIIRFICLLELKLKELDELFCNPEPHEQIREYLSLLSRPSVPGQTLEALLRQIFCPSNSLRLPQLLLCALLAYCNHSCNSLLTSKNSGLQGPVTTAAAGPIGASNGAIFRSSTKIAWEKMLVHKAPPRKRPPFHSILDIVEMMARFSWPILGSCISFLRKNDGNLAAIVSRMINLSLHRFLCFSTSHALLILEQESYLEFRSSTPSDDISDTCHKYLNNITSASSVAHAAKNMTMSDTNYILINAAFQSFLDETFIHVSTSGKASILTTDIQKMLMAFVSGHVRVISPLLKSTLEASDVPSLHVLSLSGSIIICTREVADSLDFVLQRTRVLPADLATNFGEVFSSVYPQMIRDSLLATDSRGYLTVHSSLVKEKSAKEQLKDLTKQDPIASFFNRERCDYFCFSYANEGSHYKHLDCYTWYHALDSVRCLPNKQEPSVADGQSEVITDAAPAVSAPQLAPQVMGKDTNTVIALANAFIVRLVKTCGPLNRREIIDRCVEEVSGTSNETAKSSLDNLIDMDYLNYVDGDPSLLAYVM
ncbi:Hypothetical protein GLP15_1460 [Giardia lamblia P15]|uniref:Uncharacterized protein n=1 Tax=Giardia intestinalis (strain P15) TaxID=658858 RepID=E1F8N2_GIAIA|nr:Hypothetical protein GLP15_1460 [Giardia lamblia P15]